MDGFYADRERYRYFEDYMPVIEEYYIDLSKHIRKGRGRLCF